MRTIWRTAIYVAALAAALPAAAQDRQEPDRTDPAIIERELELQEQARPRSRQPIVTSPTRAGAAAPAGEIVAGAIRVRGARGMPASVFAPAIEPFLGRPLGRAELVRLATAVANAARQAGYGLATAWVPAQELTGGVLVVEVDAGHIDAVRATGLGAALVEQRLGSIVGDEPVRTAELERQLLVVGDVAGLWVGDARLVRENGRNILTVRTRFERVQGRATLDNWGSDVIGPVRAWAEVEVNGVAVPGDRVSLGVATTPLNPQEFQLLEGRYRLPLGGRGTTVAVSGYYGRTDAEADAHTRSFEGDSWEIELEAAHPLARARAESLWISARFELRDSAIERAGTPIRDDRIASGTLSLYGYRRAAGGTLRVRASAVQGIDLFGATQVGDPLASRSDAGGTFTRFEGWADYTRPLGHGFSLQAAARMQLSDGPLLASEEMGLGGPQFLRAFDYRERSGDEGAAASLELRFDLKKLRRPIDDLQLYFYGDAGRVTNDGSRGRGGSLASAGVGARIGLARKWNAGLELGIPLTDGAGDRDPDPRISFTLRTRF